MITRLKIAWNWVPIIVDLIPEAQPQTPRQYPVPLEARMGIQEHLTKLRERGILTECQSVWNTSLLPGKKPGGHQPVQDLRAISKVKVSLHPVIPNPQYTLLSQIPWSARRVACFDLQDAFCCLCLAPQSLSLVAFECTKPVTECQMQLTWTLLSQGYNNSPILLGEALGSDLADFPKETTGYILLQYVEDLLLSCDTQKDCMKGTQALLQL